LGSGDRALVCAALGRFEDAIYTIRLNQARTAHYLDWAKPFFADVNGSVHFVEGSLFHLWHGDLKDRRHFERHSDFAKLDFNPSTDLHIDSTGVLRRNDARPEL